MFIGQVAVVSNKETWVSDLYQLINEDDGSVIDIQNPDIGFDVSLYIKDSKGCAIATFPLSGGQIAISSDADGPGFQWVIDMTTVATCQPGTYGFGVKVTANGIKSDLIIGNIAVIEGN